ncbi:MAG TPA: SRPBCC family protein [Planctomycetota bacterium]|nr:SRPBCC family protein [Planctomycetota bacterium]
MSDLVASSRGKGTIRHSILVPDPRAALVEQFFDFEHVPFVHGRTLGRIEVLSLGDHELTGVVRWPVPRPFRLRSVFRERFHPPDRITSEVLEGFGSGAAYEARFTPEGEGTRVKESLDVPGFRGLLAGWGRRAIVAAMRRVWDEDLKVLLSRRGWPGIEAVGISRAEL